MESKKIEIIKNYINFQLNDINDNDDYSDFERECRIDELECLITYIDCIGDNDE